MDTSNIIGLAQEYVRIYYRTALYGYLTDNESWDEVTRAVYEQMTGKMSIDTEGDREIDVVIYSALNGYIKEQKDMDTERLIERLRMANDNAEHVLVNDGSSWYVANVIDIVRRRLYYDNTFLEMDESVRVYFYKDYISVMASDDTEYQISFATPTDV